jgi:TP901 family phage tail tape measure protein
MKLATLAGLDFKQATSLMTAATRGFKMGIDDATKSLEEENEELNYGEHVTDVYSELAAHAAASVNDIAQAMSRTAAIANSAGMEFETTSAMLTTMIEATQESPETLGTAMKTVIARFTELKKNVSATESEFEDLDYNKVDTALKSIGVALKDVNGQFRDIDDVFLDVADKWNTLDRNTQRYIATTAAGSR